MAGVFQMFFVVFLFAGGGPGPGPADMQLDGDKSTPCDCKIVGLDFKAGRWVTVKCKREQEHVESDGLKFQYQWLRERILGGFIENRIIETPTPADTYTLPAPTAYGNYTCTVSLPGVCNSHCMFWFNSTYWWKAPSKPITYSVQTTTSSVKIFPSSASPAIVPLTESAIQDPSSQSPDKLTTVSSSDVRHGDTSTPGGTSTHDSDVGIKVGIGVGVVLCIVLVTCAAVWFYHKRRISKDRETSITSRMPLVKPVVDNFVVMENFDNLKDAYAADDRLRKRIKYTDPNIGKGHFGSVQKALLSDTDIDGSDAINDQMWTPVAIKTLDDRVQQREFRREIELLRSIPHHANITTLVGACTVKVPYLMILEYAPKGDLKKYLLAQKKKQNPNGALLNGDHVRTVPDAGAAQVANGNTSHASTIEAGDADGGMQETPLELLQFCLQIARGLEHLVENLIVHRDIATRNILLFQDKVVKIADFGLARKLDSNGVYENNEMIPLPIRWLSPEALVHKRFSQMSDVWSFGILLWEIATLGCTPYPGLDRKAVVNAIRNGEVPDSPPHVAKEFNDIMLSCWKMTADERLPFSRLCKRLEELLETRVEYLNLDQLGEIYFNLAEDVQGDMSMGGAECVAGEQENVAGEADVPVAGEADAPVAGEADAPVAGEADAPVAGEADAPVAGEADAPVAGEADVPVAGEAGVPEAEEIVNEECVEVHEAFVGFNKDEH